MSLKFLVVVVVLVAFLCGSLEDDNDDDIDNGLFVLNTSLCVRRSVTIKN